MTEPEPVWLAVVADNYGYVLTEEDIREWAADSDAYEIRSDMIPQTLAIVTDSAKPDDGERSGHPRLPRWWAAEDRFMELDVDTYGPDHFIRLWERAQAVAAAMNAADVR